MRLAVAVLLFGAGCERGDPRFESALVDVEMARRSVLVTLPVGSRRPCPTLESSARISIGGVAAWVRDPGGENRDPDIDYGGCIDVVFGADDVPLDRGRLPVEVHTEDQDVVMDTDWPEHAVATEDDLASALANGELFTVTWTPADASLPTFSVYQDGFPSEASGVVLVEESVGSARFRFTGAVPEEPWGLVASSRLMREATTCDLDSCAYVSDLYVSLR